MSNIVYCDCGCGYNADTFADCPKCFGEDVGAPEPRDSCAQCGIPFASTGYAINGFCPHCYAEG